MNVFEMSTLMFDVKFIYTCCELRCMERYAKFDVEHVHTFRVNVIKAVLPLHALSKSYHRDANEDKNIER